MKISRKRHKINTKGEKKMNEFKSLLFEYNDKNKKNLVKDEIILVYGDDIKKELGSINDTLIEDIVSITTNPEEWEEAKF